VECLSCSSAWGKEKADMMIRLNEAENGFGRANGMVLHDYPVYVSLNKLRHIFFLFFFFYHY
jgi:hypothetical protein